MIRFCIKRFVLIKTNSFNFSNKSEFQRTIFDKILSKQIPSEKVYQDDQIYAFDDINPQAPVHVLVIPKNKNGLTGISKAKDSNIQILGYLLKSVNKIAEIKGINQSGYRIVINQGKHGQQTVDHLHLHLIGGRQMNWPPG